MKQFVKCLGVVAILLLNVMEVFSVGGGALLIDHIWYSKECTCCACDTSVHVLFMFLYVGIYLLISEFESWITCVCSPYVVSLCDFAYHVVG